MRKKPLCNTLNWGNWNSGFLKLGVRWAERDIWIPCSLDPTTNSETLSFTNKSVYLLLFLFNKKIHLIGYEISENS